LLLTIWKHGIGITTDSITYIGAAENLADGKFFVHKVPLATPSHYSEAHYYHEWAPLLPALLAGPMLFGIPPEITAAVLNMLSFCLIVLLVNRVLDDSIRDRRLVLFGTVFTVLSLPLYLDATVVMSESPFNLFAVSSMASTYFYFRNGSRKWFWASVTFAALACLTRYIGIVLLISSGLSLFLAKGKVNDRFKRAMFFGIFSAFPTGLFIIRNKIVAGTLVGQRYGAERGLVENSMIVYVDIVHWFVPSQIPNSIWIPASMIAISLLIILFVYGAYRLLKEGGNRSLAFSIFGLFTLVYLPYLLISASSVGFTRLTDRFLSPLYAPGIIILVILLDVLLDFSPFRRKTSSPLNRVDPVKAFVMIASSILVFGSAASVLEAAFGNVEEGTGVYSNDEWRDSEVLEAARDLPDGKVYSNFPHQVYYFTGIDARYSPLRTVQGSSERIDGYSLLNASLGSGYAYLVWIDIAGMDHREWEHTLEESGYVYDLEMIGDYPDGSIYSMRRG